MSLFAALPDPPMDAGAPLAERMRPQTLDEFVGQEHILGPGKALRMQIERDDPGSLIFWGPPGVGKTTLAKIIARTTRSEFQEFSAVLTGIAEIKQVMAAAERARRQGIRTLVFVDEIHRFNKAQQDAFLPYVERGSIRLIGATTENPSFEIIAALLSRCRVYTLSSLTEAQVVSLLRRALADPVRGLGSQALTAEDEVLQRIAAHAGGDARSALNVLELAAATASRIGAHAITVDVAADAMQRKVLRYDKQGDQHYDLISALHKSVRNSDPDASLYWLARMLEAGEDPLFLARRLIRMAVEDIGLAAPQALSVALAARDAFESLGHPEGDLALAEAAVYLALAPKSNALYTAYGAVLEDVEKTAAEDVPLHLRNAATRLMRDMGYGKGYQYAHDLEQKVADMQCLPDNLRDRRYYRPTEEGWEAELRQRWERIRAAKKGSGDSR
jgi:putative ATPase